MTSNIKAQISSAKQNRAEGCVLVSLTTSAPLRGPGEVFAFFPRNHFLSPFRFPLLFLFQFSYLWLFMVHSFKYSWHPNWVLVTNVKRRGRCSLWHWRTYTLNTPQKTKTNKKNARKPNLKSQLQIHLNWWLMMLHTCSCAHCLSI